MLRDFFWTKKKNIFFKFGMGFDFFFKKLAENSVKNLLVYSNYIFGEKYIVEYISLKFINFFKKSFSKNNNLNNKNYNDFILFIVIIFIYLIIVSILVIMLLF